MPLFAYLKRFELLSIQHIEIHIQHAPSEEFSGFFVKIVISELCMKQENNSFSP